jgi:hypothetical protein
MRFPFRTSIRDIRFAPLVPLAPLAALAFAAACSNDNTAPEPIEPGDAVISADITQNRTFHAETTYTISGFVHVANGATLTIEPGTKIVGDFNVVGSSLFVLRGAKIEANGTAAAPIVFTSSRPVGQRRAGDWGGLILIGNGLINRTGTVVVEGTGTSANNYEISYAGGNDNADNSGTLRYVRVEFAGFAPLPNNELNSFTFAAVGSGTVLSNLQSMYGLDDSFEWFGGAVNADHLVSYEAGDDHFDQSEGYSGRVQYAIAYQSRGVIARSGAGQTASDPEGIENDGCAAAGGANCPSGASSTPYTMPLIANFTLVGTGDLNVASGSSGGIGMMLRRGTGGYYVNGIVTRWPRAAMSIRDTETQDRIVAGDLQVSNILSASNAVLFQTGGTATQFTLDATANHLETSAATLAELFTSIPATAPSNGATFDWTPATASPARTGGLATFTGALATKGGTAVAGTAYRGAADPNGTKWWQGWTTYVFE